MKFEYVFSDPECTFMFCVCEMLKAMRIILKGRTGELLIHLIGILEGLCFINCCFVEFSKYRRGCFIS